MSEIRFMLDDATEILRLSKDGIWVNPAYPVEETAQRVLDALSANVRVMVEKAVEAEREACAELLDDMADQDKWSNYYKVAATAIRARGDK